MGHTKILKMTRKEAIDFLVNDDIEDIAHANFKGDDDHFLNDILRDGFKGYTNESNTALQHEIAKRMDKLVMII